MNLSELHDAIGELPEDLLVPVEKLRQRKHFHWARWGSLAACLCLLTTLGVAWIGGNGGMMDKCEAESVQEAPAQSGEIQDSPLYRAEDYEYGGMTVVLRGKVLEVYGREGCLVATLEGNALCDSVTRFEISFQALSEIPDIREGDILEIVYDGTCQEVYPPRITEVISVTVIE